MTEEWWYSTEGERKGPLSIAEICGLVEKGILGPRNLVWKKGLEDWQPISNLNEFAEALKAMPPELPKPTPREINIELPLAGPWRRFFARLIDLYAIGMPTGFLVSLVGSSVSIEFALWIQKPGTEYAFGWLMLPLVLFVEGIIYGIFGSTLGKALLGIKVVTVSAHNLSLKQYLSRLVGVYWSGLGTGFPFVSLFTMAHQYGRLKRGMHAGYDEGQCNVKASKIGVFRVLLAAIVVGGLSLAVVVLQAANQEANRSYYSSTAWTNDVTGRTVSIPAGWIHDHQENEDGQPFDVFSNPRVGGLAIFAKEDLDPSISLQEYAQFWAVATKETMNLVVPGRTMQVRGRSAVRVTGFMTDDRTQRLDAILVRNGRHVWRVVLLGTSSKDPASEEAVELRDTLIGSIQ